MKQYKKLAVFGGTFSPVHNGHLLAMRAYAETVQPDVLYVIPTAVPPHKMRKDSATDRQRLDMLHLAVRSLALPCEVVISDMEIVRGGKSYTVDTVKILREIADEVVIYCGTDMLLTLDGWYDHKQLLKLAAIAYMQREDDGRYTDAILQKVEQLTADCDARFIALPSVSAEVSSSTIRERVQRGEDITELVPESIASYIRKEGLYRGEKGS